MTKKRSEAMQRMAMEVVEIRPLSAEAQRLIDEALETLGLEPEGNRSQAFQLLREGGLDGVDVGGEILNKDMAVEMLIQTFGCTRATALRHVARAARRKRHPDYQVPAWGGARRLGEQRRLTADDVCEIRRLYANGSYSLADLGDKYDVDPSHISRIVNHHVWKDVDCDE